MATKKLKSIAITLIGCGEEPTVLNASDTADKPIATYALDMFLHEQQMVFENEGATYYVPFHAVDHIIVTETEAEVEDKPNPYGCEPDGTAGGSRAGC